jgi:S1-C subfamily serine protease
VESSGQFRNAIAAAGANRQVTLELYRDGKLVSLPASLGEMPQDAARAGAAPGGKPGRRDSDGLALGELTPETRRSFGIADDAPKGVVVTGVTAGSIAARAGLRPGDVLLEVNRKAVTSVREFEEAYSKSKGNVLLLLYRRGATVFVVVRR